MSVIPWDRRNIYMCPPAIEPSSNTWLSDPLRLYQFGYNYISANAWGHGPALGDIGVYSPPGPHI